MKKIFLSAILAMGLASTAMATDNVTFQGEYHDLSGSSYDYIKAGGVKGSYKNYGILAKKWTKSGKNNVSDINGLQIGIGTKIDLTDGFKGNAGIEYIKVDVDNGNTNINWAYNMGITKNLDDGSLAKIQTWYTAVDEEKDNQQLDLTIKTKLNEDATLKGKIGITLLHNGAKSDYYAVFRAGVEKQCNEKLSGKVNVTLGKNRGMIYSNGWLIEGNEVDYKVGAGVGYKINNQNNINIGVAYTSYANNDHKTSYIANYTYRF